MISFYIGQRFTQSQSSNNFVGYISRLASHGLVLSIAILVIVVSVMNGFEKELKERILHIVPHIELTKRDGVANWQQDIKKLSKVDGVKAAAPYVLLESVIKFKSNIQPLGIYGAAPDYDNAVTPIQDYITGKQLGQLTNNDILLGQLVADKLGVTIGDSILAVVSVKGEQASTKTQYLKVAGFINTGTELDKSIGLVNLSAAQALGGLHDRVSGLKLKTNDVFKADLIAYRALDALDLSFRSKTWVTTWRSLYVAIETSKNLVWLLLLAIISIAVFNVVTTLVMVVLEKQGDIAILRTQGANKRQILGIFIVQGGLIGLKGSVIGTAIGLVFCLLLPLAVNGLGYFGIHLLSAEVYPVSFLPVDIRLTDVANIATTAWIISSIAAVGPAWLATRTQPAKVLQQRY